MNITRPQLKAQFDRAVKLGWLPFFQEAARTITKGYFDTADLMGIGSRETNLDPKWLTKKGDGGHGAGLMQADDRSFPEFTRGDGWKDAKTGIIFGAKVLMLKWNDYEQTIGKRVRVKGSTYTGKAASGSTVQHIVISSYNCGRWAQFCWARGIDIDKYSTGHDYGRDVMERAAYIRTLISAAANGHSTTGSNQTQPSDPQNDPQTPPIDLPTATPTPPQAENQTIVDVPPVATEPPEGIVSKFKTWMAALPAFATAALGGFWSWIQGAATEIIVAFFATAGVVAIVFIITSYKNRQHDKERDYLAKEKQKERDFELTKLQMQSAMDPNKQTVRIAPPPTEIPAAENKEESAGM